MTISQKVTEVEGLSRSVVTMQDKVSSLAVENKALVEELRSAKEGIRASTIQTSHIGQEN